MAFSFVVRFGPFGPHRLTELQSIYRKNTRSTVPSTAVWRLAVYSAPCRVTGPQSRSARTLVDGGSDAHSNGPDISPVLRAAKLVIGRPASTDSCTAAVREIGTLMKSDARMAAVDLSGGARGASVSCRLRRGTRLSLVRRPGRGAPRASGLGLEVRDRLPLTSS